MPVPGFQRFHFLGFGIVEMVVSLGVQGAVNDKVGGVFFQCLGLFFRFPDQYIGAQDDIGPCRFRTVFRFSRHLGGGGRFGIGEIEFVHVVIGKGQHVGCVILATIIPVQSQAFFGIDEAQRDFSRHLQGSADPAAQFLACQDFF